MDSPELSSSDASSVEDEDDTAPQISRPFGKAALSDSTRERNPLGSRVETDDTFSTCQVVSGDTQSIDKESSEREPTYVRISGECASADGERNSQEQQGSAQPRVGHSCEEYEKRKQNDSETCWNDVVNIRKHRDAVGDAQFRREVCASDRDRKTALAKAFEGNQEQLICCLLSLGAAESIFVHDSRPERFLCTLPIGRHPAPNYIVSSPVGRQLATHWHSRSRESRPSDKVLMLLDQALESHVRRVTAEADQPGTTLRKTSAATPNTAPPPPTGAAPTAAAATPKAAAGSKLENPTKPEASFCVGDRVRLRPEQQLVLRPADWAWGPYHCDSMSVSHQGRCVCKVNGSPDYSSAVGSQTFERGLHSWEVEVSNVEAMWLGIARGLEEQDALGSKPHSCGDMVVCVRSNGETKVHGSKPKFDKRGELKYASGDKVRFEVDVEERWLKMSVNGKLALIARSVDIRGSRPYVCMDYSEKAKLCAVATSDPMLMTDEEGKRRAAAARCLGDPEEVREGVVTDVHIDKRGPNPVTTVKVASLRDGAIGLYTSDRLVYADCFRGLEFSTHSRGKPKISPTALPMPIGSWGADQIAKVEVSTDKKSNGPNVLLDGDCRSYWVSDGLPGRHHIQVHIKHPGNVKDFGIILDEDDASFCPKKIRLFVDDGGIKDLGSYRIPQDQKSGAKYISLLRDFVGNVSMIKVLIEDSGGCDCRVHGVCLQVAKQGLRRAGFQVGDRVTLNANSASTSGGLVLPDCSVGVVTCAPYEMHEREQRCLMVSWQDQPDQHHVCRASWLEPFIGGTVQVGDVVQLNPTLWEPSDHMTEVKCLGHPDLGAVGIVTHCGVSRDGLQRNVEVTTDFLSSEHSKAFPSTHTGPFLRSVYPACALIPASALCQPLTPQGRIAMTDALRALLVRAGKQVDLEGLVDHCGLDSWSKIWKLCAPGLSHEAIFKEFRQWQLSRSPVLELSPELERVRKGIVNNERTGLVDNNEGSQNPDQARGGSVWTCTACKSVTSATQANCRVCGKKGKSPWKCTKCSTVNRAGAPVCFFCDVNTSVDVQSDWAQWNADVERESRNAKLLHEQRNLSLTVKSTADQAENEEEEEEGEQEKDSDDDADSDSESDSTSGAKSDDSDLSSKLSDTSDETEPPEIDPDFEVNMNNPGHVDKPEQEPEQPQVPVEKGDLFRRLVSFHFGKKQFAPVKDARGLATWTDAWGNTVAHHAGFMRLPRTLQALWDAGASPWTLNNGGETPAGLIDGESSLDEHGLIDPAGARCFELHRECTLGEFYVTAGGAKKFSAPELIRRVIRCPMDYRTPSEFETVKTDLLNGEAGRALKISKELLTRNIHARPYVAVAMLKEFYGAKAATVELEEYLRVLSDQPESVVVDPIFFYAWYQMWVMDGRPQSVKEMSKAMHALAVLRLFPSFANEWLRSDDDLDRESEFSKRSRQSHHLQEDSEDDFEIAAPEDPANQWQRAKEREGLKSKSMDQLMALTGLNMVKENAMRIVKEVLLQRRRPSGIHATVAMNFLFVGNPGSGKTTVARLLASSMHELRFRRNDEAKETSAQDILKVSDPVAEFVKMVDKAKGGTMIIDNAGRFTPVRGNGSGKTSPSDDVLDHLLTVVDTEEVRTTTTFILTGYKDEIDTLLTHDPSFSSKFPCEFDFPDFTERQIRGILLSMVKDRGFRLESRRQCSVPLAKILAHRICLHAGTKGFGNARSVRNKVEEIINNQTQRLGAMLLKGHFITEGDYRTLTRADAIGARPDFSSSPLLKQLDSLVGLAKVKEAVRKLVEMQVQNYDRELTGDRPAVISLHRVFYGNPGTGKTTVAKIYGAILKELGLLSKGDFLQCTPADLTGDAEGSAAKNTKALLEKARGKVLFIDEAYVLDPKRRANAFGGNVLDTLVEKLDGDAGSDIAVILGGYKQEMFDMLQNNPGLRRRFNIDDFGIHFEDLSDSELRKVLIRSVGQAGLILANAEVEDLVVNILSQKRRLPSFGNAGTVHSILNVAKVNRAERLSKAAKVQGTSQARCDAHDADSERPDVLIKSDFEADNSRLEQVEDDFSKLYNIQHIKKELYALEALMIAAKQDKKDPAVIMADRHMVFTGPPGTGKTTVARMFGKLFKKHGLLPSDTVIVTSGTTLQGQYVGETKNKVIKVMEQARGGILVIDEAYALTPEKSNWGYATEAVDTLIGQITEEQFKGNLIVIMAGYAANIDKMFQSVNPGFRSRFDKLRIAFPAWTGEQAADVAVREIERDGKSITEAAKEELKRCFTEMSQDGSWASARDVLENILPAMYSKRAERMQRQVRRGPSGTRLLPGNGRDEGAGMSVEAAVKLPYDISDVMEAFRHALGARVPQMDTPESLDAALQLRQKLVVVDFFAEWCGSCKTFEPIFAALKAEFGSVTFLRVNVEKNTQASERYHIEAVPTIVMVWNGATVKQISGPDEGMLRQYIKEFIKDGFLGIDRPVREVGHAGRSNLKAGGGTSDRGESAVDEYAIGDGSPVSAWTNVTTIGSKVITNKKVNIETKHKEPEEDDDPEFAGRVFAALEEACHHLGYSLDEIAGMLRARDSYSKAVIVWVKKKTGCNDEVKIRNALDRQKAAFLSAVERLISERKRLKTAEEAKAQDRIKRLGRCPLDFEWIKVEGGYCCAGGSHFLSDAELLDSDA